MIYLLPKIFALEVPEDAWDFEFKESEIWDCWVLIYKTKWRWEKYKKENWDWQCQFEYKPDMLFTANTVTEADARKLIETVGPHFDMYPDFEKQNSQLKTAVDSLQSLLRFKGLNVKANYLLIKILQ